MILTRRAVLAAGAASLAALAVQPSRAQSLRFDAAAAYSAQRRGVSLLVMEADDVLFEDYPNDGGPDAAWELASGTKSFCGVIAAAAAADGLLTLDERAVETLPEWRDHPLKSEITLRDLLTLTSGIADGSVGRPPTYDDAIEAEPVAGPGERFAYGPTPFQIFGEIMRRKLAARGSGSRGGPADAAAYLRERVLAPIGAEPALWRAHRRDGLPLMPQGAHFTARRWAAFGRFIFDGGAGLHRPTLAACFEGTGANPGYGLTWWLLRPGLVPPGRNAALDAEGAERFADEDIVMAAGAGGQRLYLMRGRGLVVVRQATGILRRRGGTFRDEEFLAALLG